MRKCSREFENGLTTAPCLGAPLPTEFDLAEVALFLFVLVEVEVVVLLDDLVLLDIAATVLSSTRGIVSSPLALSS